jgi:dienelactone hydrolase
MAFTGSAQQWLLSALDSLTFPESWLSGRFADFGLWHACASARLAEVLGPLPAPVPFDVQVLREEDRGSHTATLLSFRVDAAYRTEAYLLMPHGPGPFPAVLALHDHGAFYLWGKEKLISRPLARHPALAEHVARYYGGRFVGDELAQRGYAVMAIDQWLWGEKRVPNVPGAAQLDLSSYEGASTYNVLAAELERQISFAMIFAGHSLPGQMLFADRRALDLLLKDRRVDPKRIGCLGLSVGGFRSIHLAAMDARVQAAVEIGWMCGLASYLRNHDHLYRWPNVIGLCAPGMTRYLDFPDVASLICPRPLLMMAGRQDTLYPLSSVEEAFAKIQAVYDSQGAAERVEAHWYEVPHCFDVPMQEYAFGWLDRWLRE